MALVIDGHEFYTTEEACLVLGVKPATLYAYVSRKLLRSYRQGLKRQRLYRRGEVEALRAFGASAPRHSTASADADEPDAAPLPAADSWIPYT